jgi:hypothetical protein
VKREMNNPYASPAPTAPYGSASSEPYRTDDRAEVSDAAVELLRQTKPWVTFLSVMSFIGAGFMALGGIFMIAAGAIAPSGSSAPAAALGVVYLPMAALYIYPALKLWGFSSSIGRLLASRSNMDLEAALGQQKSFWKFAGIMTIVMIALYAVFFVGIMVVGGFAAARH